MNEGGCTNSVMTAPHGQYHCTIIYLDVGKNIYRICSHWDFFG